MVSYYIAFKASMHIEFEGSKSLECKHELILPNHQLQDASICWNSTYYLIDRVLEQINVEIPEE